MMRKLHLTTPAGHIEPVGDSRTHLVFEGLEEAVASDALRPKFKADAGLFISKNPGGFQFVDAVEVRYAVVPQ